jgi:hypothetical protein
VRDTRDYLCKFGFRAGSKDHLNSLIMRIALWDNCINTYQYKK